MSTINKPADGARQFSEAGYSVFGLHPITEQRLCGCGKPDCKAIGKHPIMANWTSTPKWSEEQLDTMEEAGQFDTGYGVLVKGLLAVDIDDRNGGVESYERLIKDFPVVAVSGMIVETGSGGGSKHLFYKIPEGLALTQHLDEYKGIDFKSSGFVVGSGSLHLSGNRYKTLVGSPDDIEDAPADLIDKLRKPERHRAIYESRTVDVSYNDLGDMLSYITNDNLDYDVWIKIGMSLHHASGGTAYDLWESWSATSPKHDPSDMSKKWHSFGKSANPVTLGTLVHYAEKGGWQWPVTFSTNEEVEEVVEDIIDVTGIDLRRPPGFVGEVAAWIHDQCRYVRENIAVGAALITIGNIVGLKYSDPVSDVTSNLLIFCVAGSATGKESILQASTEVMRIAGINAAIHGNIKSEQEIVRNLIDHQASFYVIDEIGFLLNKIKNAQSKGGASYLEGIIGILMSAYSKGNGYLAISGDVRKTVCNSLLKELTQISSKLEEGKDAVFEARKAAIEKALLSLDQGIEHPFVSLLGVTTLINFEGVVSFENASNGFIGRSLIFIEQDTVPAEKYQFKKRIMDDTMKAKIQQLYAAGSYDVINSYRIENYGAKVPVNSTDGAADLLLRTSKALHQLAENHSERTGLEALFLRAKELVAKISFILAAPSGLRTVEHVLWAYALVKNDVETKGRMVIGNDRQKDAPEDALIARLMNILGIDKGITFGVITNKLRKVRTEDVQKGLDLLVQRGKVTAEDCVHPSTKKPFRRYLKIR